MLTSVEKLLFAVLLAGAIAYFAYRTIVLVRLIRMGRPDPDNRRAHLGAGIVNALLDVFLQRKVLRRRWVGFFHLLIVWGFFVFAVNTLNHFAGAFLPGFHLFGNTPLSHYYTTMADVFAVLIIAGVVGLAVRRHVLRPETLSRPSIESVIVFTFIGGAMLAYLLSNATEIATGSVAHAEYHVASVFIARGLARLNAGPLAIAAHVAWWCDALMHLGLIALLVIPTKHLHLVAGPINLAFPRPYPRGRMSMMDLEDEEATDFGVSRIDQFTWKQNLDLCACIECGRCQEFCPTYQSGKPLRPKHLIVDLKHHLLKDGPALLKSQAAKEGNEAPDVPALIGATVDTDAIWACTTCGACVEHCPMGIEHVDKLTDMRRHLTLMEGAAPEEANQTFRNLETAANPWGLPPAERAAWAEGLEVPVLAEKRETDVLFWVGCSGSYDDRSKRIAQAMVRILKAAGVEFAILGDEERCHCESARRLGNEYLYQMATQEIIETLKQYRFNRILVICPHCYNTFVNEYPPFGAAYEVIHHSQLINRLLQTGQLKLHANAADHGPVVYHDSCYLGRYNGIYDAPRHALIGTGVTLVGLERERERGLCCGAGGGRMWLEERLGEQISTLRVRELLGAGAAEIAACCPFCITMLTDAIKKEGRDDVPVKDIAEIVAGCIDQVRPVGSAEAPSEEHG